MNDCRHKFLSEIPEMKDYSKYAVDIKGDVWSLKYKKPNKLKPGCAGGFFYVRLTDDNLITRTFYNHKLVALAFIPTDDTNRTVRHKNGNITDNHIDNLEWHPNKRDVKKADEFVLNRDIINRIIEVHKACQKKGIRTGNSYDFTNMMINNALDEYIIRYGLRKVMN